MPQIPFPNSPLAVGAKPPPQSTASTRSGVFAYNGPAAVLAALIATAAITVYMLVVPRMLGIEEMDIGITVGQLSAPNYAWLAFLMRVAWHVGNGLVYVFAYAGILLYFQKQSSLMTGVIFGVVLLVLGPMLFIPIGLEAFPSVASGWLTNPGIFMLDLDLGWKPAATDLGAHLIHGVLTGVIYKHRALAGEPAPR